MTTVYLVTSGEYSDYGILAAFSTEEAADAYVAHLRSKERWSNARVETYPVDRWLDVKDQHFWHVRIYEDVVDPATGASLKGETTVTKLEPDVTSEEPIPIKKIYHQQHVVWFYHSGPKAGTWSAGWEYGPLWDRTKLTQHDWGVALAADDEQHAIKIVAEMIAQERARLAGM
jgi:hypothetical protein